VTLAGKEAWNDPAPGPAGVPSAYGLEPADLEALGAPGRAAHVFGRLQRPWTWREGEPWLSRETRDWMRGRLDLGLPRILEENPSSDGSTRMALGLADGARIEAVHMPREVRNPRVTLCISSQVGCAMGCTFCATGAMGIRRNLSAGEIVGQVLALVRARGPEKPHALTLVFMGMGEPLHNLEEVHRAIRILNHPQGLNISVRRITVSTSGLVPAMERLAGMSPRPWLALSLNATTDEARNRIMPVNRAWNLSRLREALERWTLSQGERLLIEYVLMADENDTLEDADRLADWLGELRHRHTVNLIRMNEHPGSPFREPGEARLQAFSDRLRARGCFVTVRRSRGRDVRGACGQLAGGREPLPPDLLAACD
jgi:23S rRNA (adenine2503-C2)-methyltransferase